MALVQVFELHKWYDDFHAVKGVSFEMDHGQILGFVGPNGAGKTTTIRIMAGLLRPSSGQIHIDGHAVFEDSLRTRALTGFMPDEFGVYENTTVVEYLDFFAESFEIPESERGKLIEDVLALTELAGLRNRMVENLSRGQSQRVSLARCLLHDPKVLLLDEPASGLDPRARIELRELLKELSRMGKAILISSHILTELEDLCTHLAIIENGALLASGPKEQVLSHAAADGAFRLKLTDRAEEAMGLLSTLARVQDLRLLDGREIVGRYSGSPEEATEVVSLLVRSDFKVMGFTQEKVGLEEVFLRITERGKE